LIETQFLAKNIVSGNMLVKVRVQDGVYPVEKQQLKNPQFFAIGVKKMEVDSLG
jgi:hypothetical protein